MNWGYHKLSASDALILCEKDKYYVARHVWDNWYRLDNWKQFLFTDDICNEAKNKVKEISLAFKKKTGNGELSNLKILLKTCNFKKNGSSSVEDKQWSWNMECQCQENGQTNGTEGEKKECVTLSINKNNYKLEYKRERKNARK